MQLNRKTIPVDTQRFADQCRRGSLRSGDINDYPGKKKLILSGFHEAALAAFAVKEYLQPGQKVHLQYTTTSPLLQKRLGVTADGGESLDSLARPKGIKSRRLRTRRLTRNTAFWGGSSFGAVVASRWSLYRRLASEMFLFLARSKSTRFG